MKMMTVLCISHDSGASRPPRGLFRNHENDDIPLHMILRRAAPLPPTPKTMKMLTVLCISYDSEATRPPPNFFQRHENDDSPLPKP